MSTLTAYATTSPYGKTEECAQFGILDAREIYTLFGVAFVGEIYVLSFWVRSDSSGSLTVCNVTIPTTTEWEKYSIPFNASSEDLAFDFESAGTYYIYHAQLEVGNKVTGWMPSPEDTDEQISSVNERVDSAETSITQNAESIASVAERTTTVETGLKDTGTSLRQEIFTQKASVINDCKSIIMTALESYTLTEDHDTFKKTVESQFQQLSDQINLKFSSATERTEAVNGEMQSKFEEMYKYFTFSQDGLVIGSGDSAITLTLDNDGIAFKRNNVQFGYWDGNYFYTGNIVVTADETARIGNFEYQSDSDGGLTFSRVGG